MRLQVISLPARADRRAQFTAWNARDGIEIAFVGAVIGANADRRALHAQGLLSDDVSTFSPGALGNALSNHALWLQAAQGDAPLFACEDDACLRGDFAAAAPALIAALAPDWELCFFGYNTDTPLAAESAEGLKTIFTLDDSVKRAPGFFARFARLTAPAPNPLRCFHAWGTLCYAISPAGARKLLKACFPLSSAPDIYMFGQNRTMKPYTLDGMLNLALQREDISAWCAYPPLALSANLVSDSNVVS